MSDIYDYFPDYELECRCGCGYGARDMVPSFMGRLIAVRVELNAAMALTSAFRCRAYNSRVSSTGGHGPHTTGRAVDVRIAGEKAYRLIALSLAHGMTGIGVRQKGDWLARFIHLDDLSGEKRPRVWSY